MSHATAIAAIPEPGQLVEVRGRRFAVTDVRASTLPYDALRSQPHKPQHLVSLSSVEDDALGEELQVIWELEPGAIVYEKMELPYPSGFDTPERLAAFLDAVRWGASSTADLRSVQSPFRSGIDIEDYQLDPVVRAIQMPRVNLLIADDVGLGKTIEAGLVAQELILRQRSRRILIVCPSSLQVQWQEQMRDKFGLDFRIVNSDLMRDLRRNRGLHVNPWQHFPRLITSIDFLKRDRPLRLMREALPAEGESVYPRRFDLLIVDEAHNIAPSGGGRYAVDSQRTAAIRLLVPHFEHKLFLTATPHNGYLESFTALLELLDSQRFARGIIPDRNQLQVVMVRRLKRELPPRWDGTPRFAQRQLAAIPVDYSPEEKRANELLNNYTTWRRKDATDKMELYATEFVLKLLKKRLFSCPAAFLSTLEKHQISLEEAKRKSSRTIGKPNAGILRRQLEEIEEDFADDDLYEESTDDAIATTSRLFRELTPGERHALDELKTWAERASRRPDSKARELLNWIETHIKPGGNWSTERVIIFTEYRATQKWLYDLLAGQGLAEGDRLMTLYGGMNSEDRERIKAAFQAGADVSDVRILLATDAASEGLDLQNHCSNLIHYEIPWNPNRMEQRNGRIDRHGQKAPQVMIYHFVGKSYQEQATTGIRPGDLEGDLEFLMRAALKINNIREDLGKVGPVIAQQVEEAMLGRRVSLDTTVAEKSSEPVRQMLKFERKVRDQIEKLKEQFEETRSNLRLTPDNIEAVVKIGLEIAQQPPLIPVRSDSFRSHTQDITPEGGTLNLYYLPALSGSWASCSTGLAHPHTGEIRPIAFDPDVTRGRDDVVLVHLNHRLVQMCLRLLRAEVWSRESNKNLHRVTVEVLPSNSSEFPVVVAYGRLVILGGDSQRLHEEMLVAGGVIKQGKFEKLGVLKLQELIASAKAEPVPETMSQKLVQLWPNYAESLLKHLENRMRDRTASLEKSLQERCDQEVADITAILTELKTSIEQELAEPEFMQLELTLDLSDTERTQFDRDINSLKARLAEIPKEIERETAAVRQRFAQPSPRLFPLAITYLVPKKLI
ncbi:DISARM system SNF2-like helicase DrmD [Laspinema olomoucense]|uniref:DISARM system SNF2-like helicase DrmD n=1 Tax=Laspinema olomoucense TaxID=3231600 RepID=UPI0021BAF280|nr:DISARM system SNF2-like helicase DrmD [Laspinema sp. D3c]MCT7992557.1 DISARM system SNF2-like helicase DrmD [Laspinema sp. D3c]